ncbi:MAG TPA: signal peptidase I [Caulobacteraceae bacterium]|jgi:signal peptidase I|nr:signal peptidase I [Caulobacteraceae bacterium]
MTDAAAKPVKPAKAEKKKLGLVGEMVEIVKTVVYALLIALVLRVILFQPYTIPSASDEPNLFRGDYIIVTKWSYGWSKNSIPFSPPLFSGRIFFTPPKRGDIIVFKLPSSGHVDFIKRLIGLPGDHIQLKGGQLYINGKAVAEKPLGMGQGDLPGPSGMQPVKLFQETNPEGRSYKIQLSPSYESAGDTGEYVVPPHCYFMMGDNRDNSLDSRFDPGLAPDDPKLGGCGWNSALDEKVGDQSGVGFVPEENLVGRARLILLSWNTGPDEEHPGGASIFKPWTWFTDARVDRFFKVLQ